MEEQQNHFAPSLHQEEVMASLKALREDYQWETETVAKSAKTATFEKKCSQISHFSRVLHDENKEELQFLREMRKPQLENMTEECQEAGVKISVYLIFPAYRLLMNLVNPASS